MADALITRSGPVNSPLDYVVPSSAELVPVVVSATFADPTNAGPYVPVVTILTPNGDVLGPFPLSQSIAAGASARVAWFRGVAGASSGGGGGGGGTRRIFVPLTTADGNSNAYPIFTFNQGYATVRNIVPGFQHGLDGTWDGNVTIPDDYSAGGNIVLHWTTNTNVGNVRWIVSSRVIADAAGLDGAYTAETAQVVAAPGAALQRVTTSFTLSTTPVAGRTLEVRVERAGNDATDTCGSDALLVGCEFQYTAGY